MEEKKTPGWLRALDVVFGIGLIISSITVLLYSELAIYTMITVLSAALLIIGVARVLAGIFALFLPKGFRMINLGVGILSIVIALVVLLYPQLATQLLIYFLSLGLLLLGIVRVLVGGYISIFQNWLRGLLIVVGLSTIILSVLVLVYPAFGFRTLIAVLSVAFLFNGLARVISGVTGIR